MSIKVAISFAVAIIAVEGSSALAEPMNGTFSVRYDKQGPQPIGPDRLKIDESGSGLNKSPGQPLDNAQVTLQDSVMLVKGKGPMTGTVTFTTPSGSVTSTLRGKVMTDAQGRVTAVGKSKVVQSTGTLAGTTGSGTFSTAFSSPTDQTTEWQGNFKPPSGMASNR